MKIWTLIMVGACFSCQAFNSEGTKLEGQNMGDDIEQILSRSKAFSNAYMEKNSITMGEFYGRNGKILPPNQGSKNKKKEIIRVHEYSMIQPSGRYLTIETPELSHEIIKETKSDIYRYAEQRNLKLSGRILFKKTDDDRYSISQFIQKQNPSWKIDIRKPGDDNKEILTLRGVVYDVDGKTPMPNFNLWVFHTDSEGFYLKNEKGEDEGWRKSRYSKRFKTGDKGQFEITTIRPAGYPNSIHPEHIHIRLDHPKYDEQEHTVYFTDSKRYGKTIQDLQRQYDFVYVLDVAKNPKNLVNWNIILLEESNLHSD